MNVSTNTYKSEIYGRSLFISRNKDSSLKTKVDLLSFQGIGKREIFLVR